MVETAADTIGDPPYMNLWKAHDAAPRMPAHDDVIVAQGPAVAKCRGSQTTKRDPQTDHLPIQSIHSKNFENVVGTVPTESGN